MRDRGSLLTSFGGGYGVDLGIEMVKGLISTFDAAYQWLLIKHLVDIRDKAQE